MGFFRRHKLSDYTADECRKQMKILVREITMISCLERIDRLMVEWACFRELLARHEGKNESQLDEKS